jgi:sigma-54 dependent transcriptional regulator, acetoin dehydrogenase operon transcriptional activator AcoR
VPTHERPRSGLLNRSHGTIWHDGAERTSGASRATASRDDGAVPAATLSRAGGSSGFLHTDFTLLRLHRLPARNILVARGTLVTRRYPAGTDFGTRRGGGLISLDREAQRRTEHEWTVLAGKGQLGSATGSVVQESWHRSHVAGVPLELVRAPLALGGDALALAVEQNHWLGLATDVLGRFPRGVVGDAHIVTLFDADGRMLLSEGDPATQEQLAEINFAPGGLWDESAVGTNGPGTALALGQPVHVVGVEHYCEAWQRWHCAAAPIRDPAGDKVLGALDITGPWERADSRLFDLARALVFGIERALAARELERRCRILQAFSNVVARYPSDIVLAVDRYGQVLSASTSAPAEFHPGRHTGAPIRAALAALVADGDGTERAAPGLLGPEADAGAVVYPVADGVLRIGGSILLRRAQTGSHRGGRLRSTRYSFLDLIGQSSALAEASRIAGIAAANTLPVLLQGESGVGKELFAQSIHSASARRDRSFLAVNCGAIPSELIESELFGYAGGAYSGARREGSAGKFEAADGGTLFLDEIGELPPTAQTALLRALQEGEITRVGETHARPVDVRIIAATNRDLGRALEEGGLRTDLFYRLAVLTIELPPLRHRREDIPALAQHFLERSATALGRRGLTIDPMAMAALSAYHWPGNVRELQNVIARAAALATSSHLLLADLPAVIRSSGLNDRPASAARAENLGPAAPPDSEGGRSAQATALDPDRARLLDIIASTSTMAEAAEVLGIDRSTLYRRLQRYGLQPKRVFGA